jgi:tRNA-binding protein
MRNQKEQVSKEETLDRLEIRLGRVLSVELAENAPKLSYKMKIDFGKFGIKTSIARLTLHSIEELKGKLVFAVLNFEPRVIGGEISEVLTLGVQ